MNPLTGATLAILLFFLPQSLTGQGGSTSGIGPVDFRYAPPEWQTAICLPDDPHKSLVDRSGELLYHYGRGGREFETRVGVAVAPDSTWRKQELLSPRVPIVRTFRSTEGLEIIEEAFAVTGPIQTNASVASATTPGGPVRRDVVLIHVMNRSSATRTLQPRLIVDTTREFAFDAKASRVTLDNREHITASLPMTGIAEDKDPRRVIQLGPLVIPAGGQASFFVVYRSGDAIQAGLATLEEALARRNEAVAYWERAPFPVGRVQVPDPAIQGLIDSSIRNIWQAREIKLGLPVFQVGPTCYRGLWIVDGAFLLEAATLAGAGDEARNGIAYMLSRQSPSGAFELLSPKYYKENGIVLWTCVRHAMLTQDKAWLESVWPKLERAAQYIRTLRQLSLEDETPLNDGLNPPGEIDGGLSGHAHAFKWPEFSNVHWNLAGLRAFIQAAHWLGKTDAAALWQEEFDDLNATFRKAARRDLRKDGHGNAYVPIFMANQGNELPQRGQWTFCHAVYPGQVFAKEDPLVAGTLAMLEATEREGLVYGTGWDPTGIWNYFASFYAHAWLWQGNGRKAAEVLYAFANHAAPTGVWREEQSLRGERFRKVGDMPHNWASAEFIRLAIHLLALDRGDEMHLLEGLPLEWTRPGMTTRLKGVATPFGPLTMSLQADADGAMATLDVKPLAANCAAIVVHLPAGGLERISPHTGGILKFALPTSK